VTRSEQVEIVRVRRGLRSDRELYALKAYLWQLDAKGVASSFQLLLYDQPDFQVLKSILKKNESESQKKNEKSS